MSFELGKIYLAKCHPTNREEKVMCSALLLNNNVGFIFLDRKNSQQSTGWSFLTDEKGFEKCESRPWVVLPHPFTEKLKMNFEPVEWTRVGENLVPYIQFQQGTKADMPLSYFKGKITRMTLEEI